MTLLEQIAAANDQHEETFEIPEWGGVKLRVRSMSAIEKAEIEKSWARRDATKDPGRFRADVLAQTLKAEDGTPVGSAEQIYQVIMNRNAEIVERLFDAACRVSGFREKDVETLAKN